MPPYAPPDVLTPQRLTLPAGTELWRCHRTTYRAAAFNPGPAHPHFGGSRFDGTDADPYPYLYAADERVTALAEVLLRSLEFTAGTRLVPWADARARSLTRLTTTAPLELISLVTEEDLAAVGQDSWLVEADGQADYPQTRCWVRALRRNAPRAQGMVWQSHRCRPRRAYVLFGDRCEEGVLKATPEISHDLGTPPGRRVANRMLAGLRSAIHPPDGE